MFGIRPECSVLSFAVAVLLTCLCADSAFANPELWKREGWKTNFSKKTIEFSEILSGGPPKDGIPSIDNPRFKPISEITDLKDKEPVVSIAINGDARAYPVRILMWHEIVNDTVGGEPVTITYCPLCNSAIAFDRRVDGEVLDFGTTGKLRNSDLVMYDRKSQSWWQQFTGDAIVGSMVGKSLRMLPARLESFAQFRDREGSGSAKVLVPSDPSMRRYGENPYVGYDRAAAPFLYRGSMPEGIKPMARVVAVRSSKSTFAVSLALLREKRSIIKDGVKLGWQPGQNSALDTRKISAGRDVGTVSVTTKDADGKEVPLPYDVTFAFAFHAFHPDIRITTE